MEGIIIKGVGGFYYVAVDSQQFECKAKGIFRRQGIVPLAGDRVEITPAGEGKGVVERILPRKNEWLRPPIANLDQLVLVVSSCEPAPNLTNLDKLIAAAEYKEIAPIIVVTKTDLDPGDDVAAIYENAGFPVFRIDNLRGEGAEELFPLLGGKTTALAGNTGVGKSSLLNRLSGNLSLETSEISRKLGRGRHTTRHVELYPVCGGYVADTPGFSTIELPQYARIRKEELQDCFREFSPFAGECRFHDCSHTVETGCAVLDAVRAGEISVSRHRSYCQFYEELKQIKDWEQR